MLCLCISNEGPGRLRAIEHRLQSVFHWRWRQTRIFNELSIVYSLTSRNSQNSHPYYVVSRTKKVRQRKPKCAKILSKASGQNYSLSEVADVVPGCCETISFASGIFNELSRLLHSTLETCLNSFQNSIPFLSRRNKPNESVDMPQTFQSAKLILN